MSYGSIFWFLKMEVGEDPGPGNYVKVGDYGEVIAARNKLEQEWKAKGYSVGFTSHKRVMKVWTSTGPLKKLAQYRIGQV